MYYSCVGNYILTMQYRTFHREKGQSLFSVCWQIILRGWVLLPPNAAPQMPQFKWCPRIASVSSSSNKAHILRSITSFSFECGHWGSLRLPLKWGAVINLSHFLCLTTNGLFCIVVFSPLTHRFLVSHCVTLCACSGPHLHYCISMFH